MHIERMKKMVETLRKVIDDDLPFSLQVWKLELRQVNKESSYLHGNKHHHCGFAACAVGWYLHKGLGTTEGFTWSGTGYEPRYRNYKEGFSSVAAYFGITSYTAGKLFLSTEYPVDNSSSADVAARVRYLISTEDEVLAGEYLGKVTKDNPTPH